MGEDATQNWIEAQQLRAQRTKERRAMATQIMAGMLSNPSFEIRAADAVPDERAREVFGNAANAAVMATDALIDALAEGHSDG